MTVGQMYENRRTHKVGVVESVNEKYKTVLMRDNEGKSFDVTFSTFKSNWRKYKGDEVIKTSTQVEDDTKKEKKEVEEEKKDTKKKETKKKESKPKLSREEKFKIVDSAKKVVENLSESSYEGFNIRSNVRGAILVKIGNKTQFEIWVKPISNTFNVRIKDDCIKALGAELNNIGFKEEKFFEDDTFQYSIRGFSLDSLEDVSKLLFDYFVEDVEEEEEKEDEEEEE